MKIPAKKPSSLPRPEPRAPQQVFPDIARPTYTDTLTFPEDITQTTLKEIGRYLGYYTGLHAYAVSELSKVDVQILKLRSEISVRRANVARNEFNAGKSKYEADRAVKIDIAMQILETRMLKLEQDQNFIRSRVEIFDRYCNTLSREMTRRSAEMQSRV